MLFLPLSLFPVVLLSIIHFTSRKSLSEASYLYVCAHQLSKEAVTSQRETLGAYHWQRKELKPDPAKFCQTTSHAARSPPASTAVILFITHTTKQRMFLNFKVYVLFFPSSDSYFLVKEKNICFLKGVFTELMKASFNIVFHSSSPAPPVAY